MPDDLNPSTGADERLASVLAEIQQAEEQGRTIDEQSYLARHPDLAEPLRGYFRDRAWFARLAPQLAPTATSPELPPPPRERPPGSRFGGYEILRELGRGGMGVVYTARQVALGRAVALKMILYADHADPAARQRFCTEAEAVARLQHPNIIQIHEIGEQDGLPFFSMELCTGGSLADRIRAAPLPPAEAARLVELLARAVHVAHGKGVLHRDLKPTNVLLGEDGAPKVGDFGLAKKLDEVGQTHSGAVVGTPSYMAPEQAAGKVKDVGPAADVYALGGILYECLTARPPFRAATVVATLNQVMSDDPVPPRRLSPGTPRDLETICLKCLRKEPAKRYASASDLADDLSRYQKGQPILARPVGVPERVWKWVRRHPAVASLLAAVALLALTTVIALIMAYHRAVTERNWAFNELDGVRASEQQAQQALQRLLVEAAAPDGHDSDRPDGAAPVPEGSITISFIAEVGHLDDSHRLLDGSIGVGQRITGSYTFDPLTPDSNPDPTVGDYRHSAAGYGIDLQLGNYRFKTDPSNVDFLLEVVCRPADHHYLLRSYNNLAFGPRLPEACADHISWQLDDPKGGNLTGDQLPLDPPHLAAWKSDFGLTITGGVSPRKQFFIRAHMVEVRKVQ
jgi:hypothetical protein